MTITNTQTRTEEQGFSLVELSIVLVIIGLIVSGVLVGRDMIKAAEIRATVAQMEKFNTASNTFRDKFNGFPGDLSTVANFDLDSANTGTDAADGDGLIEDGNCTDGNGLGGESAMFWRHLVQSNMIDSAVTTADYACAAVTTITDSNIPTADIGKGNRFHVTSVNGLNYWVIANFSAVTAASGLLTAADALTPMESFNIDTKIDDGSAATGTVVSILSGAAPDAGVGGGAAAPAADGQTTTDDCYTTGTGLYATNVATLVDEAECQLRIRTNF